MEVWLIRCEYVTSCRTDGTIVPMILGKRHTCHGTNSVLADCCQIVGKVLPLIVQTIIGIRFNGIVFTMCHR